MTTSTAPRPAAPRPHPKPPSALLQLLELRAFAEFGVSLALLPVLRRAPQGDGHPVLVLPGLIASDTSTKPLRSFLRNRGYDARGWGLGRNLGLRRGLEARMRASVLRLHEETGRTVSLVGWSLGGVFAREVAGDVPHAVRSVVTLGSPIHGHPKSTNAWRVYEWASGQKVDDPQSRKPRPTPPPLPTTSIYSRSDGVVAWRTSVQPSTEHTENVEVIGSHCGLGVNAAAMYAVADRLAQPEGGWQPFDRSGSVRGLVFPDPDRSE